MSLFKKNLQTVPPTDFGQLSDHISEQTSESRYSGGKEIKRPVSERPISEYNAITIDGIPYTKPKKWEFWKKDMAFEETKEYLHCYNQKKATASEKLFMNSILENNREIVVNDTFARIYNLVELPEILYYQYSRHRRCFSMVCY